MSLVARSAMLLIAALLIACSKKPKVGDKCDNGTRACMDATHGLYCANGVFQADTCKGPKGCFEEKGLATCDITANVDGDECPAVLDGYSVCRVDRKTRAMCKAGKYVVESCRGEEGCTTEQVGVARCDRGNPEPGEACTTDPRQQFCAAGKKSFITCVSGKFVARQKCPGPSGCTQSGAFVGCDPNGAFEVGDGCFFIQNACTAEGKSLLACKDGKFALDKECPGPDRCSGNVRCDTGYANEGEPCDVGKRACSSDKKALLECKTPKGDEDSKWSVKTKCKTECVAKDGTLACD